MRVSHRQSASRTHRVHVGVCVLAAGVVLSGCRGDRQAARANGDDPLAALTATVESHRYTNAYWADQADRATPLWAQAVAYCDTARTHGQAPINCGAVITTRFERSGRRPTPLRRAPRDQDFE